MKSPDEQALAALRAFAGELLANWPDEVGIDGFELQDLCVKHGLLVATYPKKPCMEGCWCQGYYGSGLWEGAVCYRKTELLTGVPKDPPNLLRFSGVPYPIDVSDGGNPD